MRRKGCSTVLFFWSEKNFFYTNLSGVDLILDYFYRDFHQVADSVTCSVDIVCCFLSWKECD